MVKAFIDTNILVDIAFVRAPLNVTSAKIFSLIEDRQIQGYVSALTCANLHYLIKRHISPSAATSFLKEVFRMINTIEINQSVLNTALLRSGDFEDNIQIVCAENIKADYIVTRNLKDYKHAGIPVLSPEEFLKII